MEDFCYVTDNAYSKEQVWILSSINSYLQLLMSGCLILLKDMCMKLMQVLQMESAVLNFLKFEMTAPTVRCFLR